MTRLAWLMAVLAVLVGAGIAGLYGYQSAHYVSTADASVVAPTEAVAAPQTGTLTYLRLAVGETVAKGTVVARERGLTGQVAVVRLARSGRVAAAFTADGASVSAGQELGAVVTLRQSVVVAEVAEGDASRVRPGQSVDIAFPDDPGQVRGRVLAVGRAALTALAQAGMPSLTTANALQYVPVTIQFRKGGLRVVDGMSAQVRIHVG